MIVTEYLSKPEAECLRDLLHEKGISCTLRQHGPTRFLWGGIYYQVHIDKKDSAPAREITDAFNKDLGEKRAKTESLLTSECPSCKSKDIRIEDKRSLFQHLFYFRVTVRICNQCAGKWFT